MKYLLQETLLAKPGARDALLEIMKRASLLMLEKAKGCELYAVGYNRDSEHAVCITEIWETEADHDASLTVEGVRELIGEAMPLLAEMPTKGQQVDLATP